MRACTAGQRVDFRKGHDGLASMAQTELGFAPKAGVMVVFRSKRGDRVKVLFWDGSGIVPLGDEDIACRAMDDFQTAGTGRLCLAEGWRWGDAAVAGAV